MRRRLIAWKLLSNHMLLFLYQMLTFERFRVSFKEKFVRTFFIVVVASALLSAVPIALAGKPVNCSVMKNSSGFVAIASVAKSGAILETVMVGADNRIHLTTYAEGNPIRQCIEALRNELAPKQIRMILSLSGE